MCDVISGKVPDHDKGGVMKPGETELVMKLDVEHDIWINPKMIELGGVIHCKHPDTDWHVMELKAGEGLHCPAETELKMVLPKPYIEGEEHG